MRITVETTRPRRVIFAVPPRQPGRRINSLTPGKTYEVFLTGVSDPDGWVKIRDDKGVLKIFSATWFEPTIDPNAAPNSQTG